MKPKAWILFIFVSIWLCNVSGCDFARNNTYIPTTNAIKNQTTPISTGTMAIASKVPSGTYSIIPTLEPDKAYEYLIERGEYHQDCHFPCWGGIYPGISAIDDAESILKPLSPIIYGDQTLRYKDREYMSLTSGRRFIDGDTEISFLVGLLYEKGNETVERLHIAAKAFRMNEDGIEEPLYGSPQYEQVFQDYNINMLLSEYGIPSKAFTFAYVYDYGNDNPFPNTEEFQLLLQYDSGIYIEYRMPLRRAEEGIGVACPSEATFDMWLVSSENFEFFQEMWSSSTTGSTNFEFRKPVEESTQMTFNEFFEVFKESNTQCFETPLYIWPEH